MYIYIYVCVYVYIYMYIHMVLDNHLAKKMENEAEPGVVLRFIGFIPRVLHTEKKLAPLE